MTHSRIRRHCLLAASTAHCGRLLAERRGWLDAAAVEDEVEKATSESWVQSRYVAFSRPQVEVVAGVT